MKIFEKAKDKLNSLDKDQITVVLMGVVFIGGIGVGVIYGKDLGYAKGLSEFRKIHIDIMKIVIDECGAQGAFQALDYIRSTPGAVEALMKDPDSVLKTAQSHFYKSDYVTKLLGTLNE